jgi:nicotinate-nucleotide pyrophosphorylase (carboxylating)
MTRAYVDAMNGRATLLDTRKTIPGLRMLEKYATRMGGATNYRMGLWDAVMIKDNHVAVAGGVGPAVACAKAAGVKRIICEVDRLDQIEPAIAAGATQILLDNMSPAMLAEAVTLVAGRAAWSAARYDRRDRGDRCGLRLGRAADAKRPGGGYRAGF